MQTATGLSQGTGPSRQDPAFELLGCPTSDMFSGSVVLTSSHTEAVHQTFLLGSNSSTTISSISKEHSSTGGVRLPLAPRTHFGVETRTCLTCAWPYHRSKSFRRLSFHMQECHLVTRVTYTIGEAPILTASIATYHQDLATTSGDSPLNVETRM